MKTRSFFFLACAILLANAQPAEAFSESFLKQMTAMKQQILFKGKKLSADKVKESWRRFDEEVIALLKQDLSTSALNRETRREEIVMVEKYRGEIETIELGFVQAKFWKVDKNHWLVAYYNQFGSVSTSTFHFFLKEGENVSLIYSLEDWQEGWPWAKEDIQNGLIQIQMINPVPGRGFLFTSLHKVRKRPPPPNRLQIVWEYGEELKPILYIPQVDWHVIERKIEKGRGEIISLKQ